VGGWAAPLDCWSGAEHGREIQASAPMLSAPMVSVGGSLHELRLTWMRAPGCAFVCQLVGVIKSPVDLARSSQFLSLATGTKSNGGTHAHVRQPAAVADGDAVAAGLRAVWEAGGHGRPSPPSSSS
jgi:hypothetical protein